MKKTPNMREYLRKAGVKPRDIREAVENARFVTEQTEIYSGIAEEILSRIATHPRVGNRTKRISMKAFLLALVLVACGGSESTELFAPSFPTSPVADGGLSEDHLAGSDGAHDPGLDATASGEFRGDGAPDMLPVDGPPVTDIDDASLPRDVLADPWPADVVVERVPPPNCFVDQQGNWSCCFARNQPPVDCENQAKHGFCDSCPR